MEHVVMQPTRLGTSSFCWWTSLPRSRERRSETVSFVCERQFRFSSMVHASPSRSGGRTADRDRSGPAYRKMSSLQSRGWTDSPSYHPSLWHSLKLAGGISWIWMREYFCQTAAFLYTSRDPNQNVWCFVRLKVEQTFLKKWEYCPVQTSSQHVNHMFYLPFSSRQLIQLHPLQDVETPHNMTMKRSGKLCEKGPLFRQIHLSPNQWYASTHSPQITIVHPHSCGKEPLWCQESDWYSSLWSFGRFLEGGVNTIQQVL